MGGVDQYRRRVLREKGARIQAGGAPRVLDLFAGCGGMSLGASFAGCEILGAVETDPVAAETHALNFHPDDERHAQPLDLSSTDPRALPALLGWPRPGRLGHVDIIVGGPPCQAFSRIGRAKLREIHAHPQAFLRDPRASLYRHYLHYVRELAPLAVIVENVPDVLNHGGRNIFEEMCLALSGMGYACRYGLLNAVHHGVPQMRTRAILVAVARSVTSEIPSLPPPANRHELPSGYLGAHAVAVRRALVHPLFPRQSFFVPTPTSAHADEPAVTAGQAIGDLPPLRSHLSGLVRRGPQRFETAMANPADLNSLNDFAALMRSWSGFESPDELYDHVTRHLPRDYPIFAAMAEGDQYPKAHETAERLFRDELRKLRNPPAEGTEEYWELRKRFVPPYDPHKFPNKWRKMERDQPARTLMAHLEKDCYSHIHYDSSQARTITVREAARLQSFPDGFVFAGSMNAAFRQIGNAVPPLLANAIVERAVHILREGKPIARRRATPSTAT